LKPVKKSNLNVSESFERGVRKLSPIQFFTYMAMAGISTLFFGLTLAYMYTKQGWTWQQFPFPKLFLISTVILVLSSFTINMMLYFYKKDNFEAYKRAIYATFFLGLVFLVLQVCSWFQLNNSGIHLAGKPDGSYLYLISGLHLLHVLVGLVLLLVLMIRASMKLKEPVKRLLYFRQFEGIFFANSAIC